MKENLTLLVVYASQTISLPSCEALTRFLWLSGEKNNEKLENHTYVCNLYSHKHNTYNVCV